MKRCLPLFIGMILLIPAFSLAQLRVAVIGGPHKASVKENLNPYYDSTVSQSFGSRNSFHVGVLIDVPLSNSNKWFFQPGILYFGKGRSYVQGFDTSGIPAPDTSNRQSTLSTNYIEVPLNIAYKFSLGPKASFLLSAGPYVSFFYNGKEKTETRLYPSNKFESVEKNVEVGNEIGKAKTFDFGFNARAGFELGSLTLTGFYTRGLTDFYRQSYATNMKHQVVGASIGFYLNKKSPTVVLPKDSDKDGIVDTDDDCPTEAGALVTGGCPDSDNDGVADKNDKCPQVAGLTRYQGCPIPDADKDGINDEEDQCPNAPGLAEFKGCPEPDRDKDGVNDRIDRCPDQPGSALNNGCPEIAKEVKEKIEIAAKQILFETASDKLKPSSFEAIEEVVALMKQDSSLRLIISGHTDNVGDETANQMLSEKRATAVRTAVIERGISEQRVKATGYGESQPIDSNDNPEGRSRNRRVELKLENN